MTLLAMRRQLQWFPHLKTKTLNEPLLGLIDREDYRHAHWIREVKNHWPKVEVLPAVLVRLRDTLSGKPSMLFRKQRFQRDPAPAAEGGPCIRSTAAEARIKDGAFVASPQAPESLTAHISEFQTCLHDLYQKIASTPPSQFSDLLYEHVFPLSVSGQLQPQDPQREELDNTTHDYSI